MRTSQTSARSSSAIAPVLDRRAMSPSGQSIENHLVEVIDMARARCDRFVIVESLPYFVQLMPNHRTLYGEVISNHYLDDADRLTPCQERRLVDLGWRLPGTPCHPDCPAPQHPNFTMTWPSTTPSKQVARRPTPRPPGHNGGTWRGCPRDHYQEFSEDHGAKFLHGAPPLETLVEQTVALRLVRLIDREFLGVPPMWDSRVQ